MRVIKRLQYLLIATIPAAIGLLSMLNNISGFKNTMKFVIFPMISMSHVFDHNAQLLRSIHNPTCIYLTYFIVISLEFCVGVFACIGIIFMIINFLKKDEQYDLGIIWIKHACLLGIFVWGFVFFCIGGDYFLSWQNPDLKDLQSGALMYVTLLAIVYFIFKLESKF